MNPTFVSTASVADLQQYIHKNKTALHVLNETGHTVLHTALIFQRVDVMKMLLDTGANVYAKSSKGWTVLDMAATEPYCQNVEIKNLFQEVLEQQRKQVEKLKQSIYVDLPSTDSKPSTLLPMKWAKSSESHSRTRTRTRTRTRSKSPRKKRKRSPSPSPSSVKKRHSDIDYRIYLDDLPTRTSHEDLWHFFERHVNEPRKVILRIRQPQRICFGFVEFKSKEDVQKARDLIQARQLWFRGNLLRMVDEGPETTRDCDRDRERECDRKKMIPSASPTSDPVTFQPMRLLEWVQQINPQLPVKDCLKLTSHPNAAKWMASPMGILDLIRQIKPKTSVEECWKIIGELKGAKHLLNPLV